MTRISLRPSSTESSSVVASSCSTDLPCAPSTSALTNPPRPRHHINRPEFPELTGQNFRNLQPLPPVRDAVPRRQRLLYAVRRRGDPDQEDQRLLRALRDLLQPGLR